MIARRDVHTGDRRAVRYVALSLHTLADGSEVWRPVGGDAQAIVESSQSAAVRACIRSIDERFQILRVAIAVASTQSHRPGDASTTNPLREIEAQAARLHREVVRLFDEPNEHDPVAVASNLRPARLSPHQLKAGHILAGLGLRDLAARTGRALSTLQAIENGHTRRPRAATLESVRAVLVAAGVEFDSAGRCPGGRRTSTIALNTQSQRCRSASAKSRGPPAAARPATKPRARP